MIRRLSSWSLRGRAPNGRGTAGQALAEFVLVAPILLLLVFGIVEFGLAFRTNQIVTNAAREGARAAVVPSGNDETVIRELVRNRLTGSGLDPEPAIITFVCDGEEGLCSSAGRTGTESEVTVQYPFRFLVLGPLMNYVCGDRCGERFGEIILESSSVMRNE